ncbi:hypothetical protein F8388_014720 [Cannabis sativa]|uniref:Reverse transcriptase zinc-binding domain-containing protein n=1 Tax=Cannabis sativa TaxID=3483 RepID=A0A7J6GYM2_CANSA|nr:hypothetical protein F8388_014720 [Cannabis sativa]
MGRDGVECNGYHQSDVQREHFYGGSYDGSNDSLCWKSAPTREFTLKRAYWDLNAARFSVRDDTFCHIWKAKIHDRFKLFLWKLCQDALPFGFKLQSIIGLNPGQCVLCGDIASDDVATS